MCASDAEDGAVFHYPYAQAKISDGTDMPPILPVSTVGTTPKPGSTNTKVDTPLAALKRCADQSTRALPPRSLTVDDDDDADDHFATPDAIFRRWLDIEVVFSHERFAAEAQWIRGA